MTLDELFEKYHEAWSAVARQTDGDRQSAGRAGVTAIVLALRDEISMNCTLDDDYSVYRWLDKILGSDAEEKVADTVAQAVEPLEVREVTGASPVRTATDAAPAVCEWTLAQRRYFNHDPVLRYQTGCGAEFGYTYKQCQGCGKPIKFAAGDGR